MKILWIGKNNLQEKDIRDLKKIYGRNIELNFLDILGIPLKTVIKICEEYDAIAYDYISNKMVEALMKNKKLLIHLKHRNNKPSYWERIINIVKTHELVYCMNGNKYIKKIATKYNIITEIF